MMSPSRPLNVGCAPLDRVRPLMDERVGVPGYRLVFQHLSPAALVDASLRRGELAVAQVSPCHFLRYLDEGGRDYVGLPVPVGRSFRHGAIYIREGCAPSHPRDLNGAIFGCPDLLATTHIWQKGILQDDYGLDLASLRWRVGKVDAELNGWNPPPAAMRADGRAEVIDGSDTLSDLLLCGEIDVLLTYKRPKAFTEGGGIRRLFDNHLQLAADSYRNTGVWPITQLMILRRDLAESDPDLPAQMATAFTAAKNVALEELRETSFYYASVPTLPDAVEWAESLFGADFWPYGVETCTRALAPFARYCREQGLTGRTIAMDEMFPHFHG